MALHIGIANIGTDNGKTGIPTISTLAVTTCKNCSECEKYCYAKKLEKLYPAVKAMHERNTQAIEENLQTWFTDMCRYISAYRPAAIRMNESGDFNTKNGYEYFSAVMKLAGLFEKTIFQGMTKCDDIVNRWIDENGDLPNNVRLSFSDFPGMDNRHGLPVSRVQTKELSKACIKLEGCKCPNQAQKEAMKKNKGFKPVKKWQCIDCMNHNCGCFANKDMVWNQH